AELARLIDAEVAQPGSRSSDEALDAHTARFKTLDARYSSVQEAFSRLQEEFRSQWNAARTWREIDGLLRVPLVPTEVRRRLLERLRSTSAASSLAGTLPAASTDKTAGSGTPSSSLGGLESSVSQSLGRETPAAAALEERATNPDPEFWNQALALARLEWGLIEIGGANDTERERLEGSFDALRRATESA